MSTSWFGTTLELLADALLPWYRRPPKESEFVEHIVRYWRDMCPELSIAYDAATHSLEGVTPTGFRYRTNIAVFFREYASTHEHGRSDYARRFAARLVQPDPHSIPTDFTLARRSLLPSIRSITDDKMSGLMLQAFTNPPELISLPLFGELHIQLSFDTPDSMLRVGPRELQHWQKSAEEILDVAIANLRDRSVPMWHTLREGVYVGAWNDDYESSRVLLSDLLHRLALKGDPVVFIPTRRLLVVTGHRDEIGHHAIVELASKAMTPDARFLEFRAYRCTEGQWAPFTLEPAAEARLQSLRKLAVVGAYEQQKPLLEKLLESREDERLVGGVIVLEHPVTHEVQTACAWGEGRAALLPDTDLIGFVAANGPDGTDVSLPLVRSSIVHAMAGHLLEATDHFPKRFSTRGFPDSELLARLAAASTGISTA